MAVCHSGTGCANSPGCYGLLARLGGKTKPLGCALQKWPRSAIAAVSVLVFRRRFRFSALRCLAHFFNAQLGACFAQVQFFPFDEGPFLKMGTQGFEPGLDFSVQAGIHPAQGLECVRGVL